VVYLHFPPRHNPPVVLLSFHFMVLSAHLSLFLCMKYFILNEGHKTDQGSKIQICGYKKSLDVEA